MTTDDTVKSDFILLVEISNSKPYRFTIIGEIVNEINPLHVYGKYAPLRGKMYLTKLWH